MSPALVHTATVMLSAAALVMLLTPDQLVALQHA